jgi:hypothetical protein
MRRSCDISCVHSRKPGQEATRRKHPGSTQIQQLWFNRRPTVLGETRNVQPLGFFCNYPNGNSQIAVVQERQRQATCYTCKNSCAPPSQTSLVAWRPSLVHRITGLDSLGYCCTADKSSCESQVQVCRWSRVTGRCDIIFSCSLVSSLLHFPFSN